MILFKYLILVLSSLPARALTPFAFAPFALGVAVVTVLSFPVQSETALLPRPFECQPLPDPATPGKFTQTAFDVSHNGFKMNAVLSRPDGVAPKAVVVFLHGYTGTLDEIAVRGGEGMFLRAARAFARHGIASLRFEFVGSGQSEGAWADTSFTSQAEDTRHVLGTLAQDPGLRDLPLHLLGFSQGGLVALKVAAGGADLRSLILWNPVLNPRQTYGQLFGPQGLGTGLQLAQAGDLVSIAPGTRLRGAFFDDILRHDPMSIGTQFDQPMLIISGTQDGIADNGPEIATKLGQSRKGTTTVVAIDGDHAMWATRSTEVIDQVIDCSASYVMQRSGVLPEPTLLAPLQ